MFKGFVAGLVASLCCAPLPAAMTHLTFTGTVTEQIDPGVDPLMAVGDTLTIAFDFDPLTQVRDGPYETNGYWFPKNTPTNVFSIRSSAGLLWKATDEELDEGVVLLIVDGGVRFNGGYFVAIGANSTPILAVGNNQFRVRPGAGSYENETPSLGFIGRINLFAPLAVPEPATWAMLLSGFGIAGVAARRRDQAMGTTQVDTRKHAGD